MNHRTRRARQVRPSERALLSIVALCLFYAWAAISVLTTTFDTSMSSSWFDFVIMRGLYCTFLAATLFFFSSSVDRILYRFPTTSLTVIAAVGMSALPVSVLMEQRTSSDVHILLVGTLWAIQGVSSAIMMCVFAEHFHDIDVELITPSLICALIGSGISIAAVSSMVITMSVPLSMLILVTFAVLLVISPVEHDTIALADIRTRTTTLHLIPKGAYIHSLHGATYGTAIGMSFLYFNGSPSTASFLIGSSLIVAAFILVLLVRFKPHLIVPETTQLVSLPFLICLITLALSPLSANSILRLVPLFMLIVLLSMLGLLNMIRMLIRANLMPLPPYYCLSSGRRFFHFGNALGWLSLILVINRTPDAFRFAYLVQFLLISLYCIYILLPPDSFQLISGDDQEEVEVEVDEEDDGSEHTRFKTRCRVMSQQYGLSPRESEVLYFLVKGRNARHIEGQLFISNRTVKTHINHIYRKVGVHTQQELIDHFDTTDHGQFMS